MPTALMSATDKTGLVPFARELHDAWGYDFIGTSGTATALREAGLPVREAAEFGNLPKDFPNGRVKTLTAQIHSGLLAPSEMFEQLDRMGFPRIDLAYVNYYDLKTEVNRPGATETSIIENTDIGGPAMTRSAAKGRRILLTSPTELTPALEWFRAGRPDEPTVLRNQAAKGEGRVASYCIESARFLSNGEIDGFVGSMTRKLRYGENPYQTAALFTIEDHPLGLSAFTQVGGTDPSFINCTDVMSLRRTMLQISAGWERNFPGTTPYIAIAVKHGNACGAAVADDPSTALQKMIDGDLDAVSFGAVVMTNFAMTSKLAYLLRTYHMEGDKKRNWDGVIATQFDEGAETVLERKTLRCRMLANSRLSSLSITDLPRVQYRMGDFGEFLREEGEPFVLDLADERMYRSGELIQGEKQDMVLAWGIGSTSKSNTITIVRNGMLIGNGVGQHVRRRAARFAILIAEENGHDVRGSVAYSDSYFPHPDGPETLARAGVKVIFASSGSVKDDVVRETCSNLEVILWQLPDKDCRGFYGH